MPSLHITIGIDLPTVSDFLLWYAQQCTRHESARRMFPTWGDADERRAFVFDALSAVTSTLSVEAVADYLTQMGASPRREFVLPTAAKAGGPTLEPTTSVKLRSVKCLQWTVQDDTLTFECFGQPYRFDACVAPALARLNEMRPVTVGELCEGAEGIVVRAFLEILLRGRVIAIAARV